MKKLSALLIFISISGCASVELKPPPCPGTRSYDVQLCRGEKILIIPNPPLGALQRKAKCDACIDIEQNCVWGVPQQCRPKWQWDQK